MLPARFGTPTPGPSTASAGIRPLLTALALAILLPGSGLILSGVAAAQSQPISPSAGASTPGMAKLRLATAQPTVDADNTSEATSNTPTPSPQRSQCLQACAAASGQCNSEVRQARQQCSRNAANAGRDPLSMRKDDYAYFCSYFTNPGRCAFGDCQRRFTGHLNLCLNVMQKNIAAMRHDCFRNERDAQRICRTELRACEATCPE